MVAQTGLRVIVKTCSPPQQTIRSKKLYNQILIYASGPRILSSIDMDALSTLHPMKSHDSERRTEPISAVLQNVVSDPTRHLHDKTVIRALGAVWPASLFPFSS